MRLFFWNMVYQISWRVSSAAIEVSDYASKRHIEIALGDRDE